MVVLGTKVRFAVFKVKCSGKRFKVQFGFDSLVPDYVSEVN